jgi:fermentation-respiration switch protein FrsA (DUF1100 family)
MTRILIRLIAVAAVLYVIALGALVVFQRDLLYVPNTIEVAPASVGLPQAEVRHFKTQDGETLMAWYVAPSPGKPLLLYFHGNAQGLDARNVRFQKLVATGDGLLAVEYRGFAGSTGSPSEDGLLLDAEATYAEALKLGFSPARIAVIGESLGTGVAVALATHHEVPALALDSPYSSVVAVAAERYWMFPVRLLMRDTFRSDLRIGQVSAPVLMVHGTADTVIPIHFAERLFALANPPKDFIRVEGAGHLAMGERIPEVLAWIDRTLL